jgi:hypothetical protein
MKTSNVILVGVVGVGAVGAYMYMKNKQAQNALLTGSLPATNQGGVTTPSGTTPSGTTPSGTTTSGTTTSGTTTSGTTAQNTEVFLPSNNEIKLLENTILLAEIKAQIKKAKVELVESKKPFTGRKNSGYFNQNTDEYKAYLSRKQNALPKLKALIIKLHDLDYTIDANDNLIKLNLNRDKAKSLKAINIQYDIKGIKDKLNEPFDGVKFDNNYSQREDRPSDWTFEYRIYKENQASLPTLIEKKLTELDDLDYTLDANDNLVMLDPNRNKEWIRVQKLYTLLRDVDIYGLAYKYKEVQELAKYGYKVDPVTKKLITI